MSTTAWLALVDGVVAVALLVSPARQHRNKAAVIAVAAVLLGIAGWLAVLAIDDGPTQVERVPAEQPGEQTQA